VRRVLRWEVPVDDQWHDIGGGKVVHVDNRPTLPGLPSGRVEVWTEEPTPEDWPATERGMVPLRNVIVVGTGHPIPDEATTHLGSVLDADGRLVWHLYEATS
jgi:hypothetical protein